MKKLILTMITSTLMTAAVAHADYNCVSNDQQTQLVVKEKYSTRVGNSAVFIKTAEGIENLYGTLESTSGGVLSKKKISFFSGGSLTIVTAPKTCGRGSCDVDFGNKVTAQLDLDNAITYFQCK